MEWYSLLDPISKPASGIDGGIGSGFLDPEGHLIGLVHPSPVM
jgi:hypothetical protein